MPSTVVVDAGPCVALFKRDDEHHQQALRFVQRTTSPLLSTLAVVTEVMYVLDFSPRAQLDFLTWVKDGGLVLIESEPNDFGRVIELMKKYASLPMDFTDGLLVALCERLGVNRIASIDRDFTIYRYKGRGRFHNVFFDEA